MNVGRRLYLQAFMYRSLAQPPWGAYAPRWLAPKMIRCINAKYDTRDAKASRVGSVFDFVGYTSPEASLKGGAFPECPS